MASRWKPLYSSVVEKFLIAVTGLGLFVYLLVHLAGNMLLYVGAGTFNAYAHTLISNPLVVPVEIGLLAIFLLHVYKTAVMWWRNRRARPSPYYQKRWAGGPSRKSWASTTMIYTGAVVALFVVLHVWAFKYGTYYQVAGTEVRDLNRLVIEFFQSPLNVAFYEVCLVLLGFHLWHGFASAFESLGADRPGFATRLLAAGRVLAFVIGGGFFSIPLWVYFFGGRV